MDYAEPLSCLLKLTSLRNNPEASVDFLENLLANFLAMECTLRDVLETALIVSSRWTVYAPPGRLVLDSPGCLYAAE